jgi:hypothetical protein
MSYHLRIRALAWVLVGFALVPRASAEPIVLVKGTIGSWTLTSPDPNDPTNTRAVLTFDNIQAEIFDSTGKSLGTFPGNATPFFIVRTPVDNPPAGTTLFAMSASGPFLGNPYQLRLMNLPPDNTAGASFGLFGNSLMPPAFQPNNVFVPTDPNLTNTLFITSTVTGRANGSNLDFSNLVFVRIDLKANDQNGKPVNLRDVLVNGGTATGTGTFVMTVPEPSSLLLAAIAILGGCLFLPSRRRRRVRLGNGS